MPKSNAGLLSLKIPILLQVNGKAISKVRHGAEGDIGHNPTESLQFSARVRYDRGIPHRIQFEVEHRTVHGHLRHYGEFYSYINENTSLKILYIGPAEMKEEMAAFGATDQDEFPDGSTMVEIATDNLTNAVDCSQYSDDPSYIKENAKALMSAFRGDNSGQYLLRFYADGDQTAQGALHQPRFDAFEKVSCSRFPDMLPSIAGTSLPWSLGLSANRSLV